jgi:L-aspartate oxidase
MQETDVLIIGSGIAGLSLAAKVAEQFPAMDITLITKKELLESNTNFAQGGIAVALDKLHDSFEKHIEDTLRAGDGLCRREVVEKVVTEGPDRLRELFGWGIDFDKNTDGEIDLGKEGGHTENRVIHYKDVTGNHVAEGLLRHISDLRNVKLKTHHFAIDLITVRDDFSNNRISCVGAVVLEETTGTIRTITSRVTVLATGGIGQVYKTTTNPLIATGDGIAIAHRAGATICDMEFIQFHPTAFYSSEENPSFLISEAVRGFGAYLRSSSGERFVLNYDQRGELASRDIVSKAIHSELAKEGAKSVYLDCRHISKPRLRKHFPNIYQHCLSKGFDLSSEVVPVAPAAHYLCGGIEVDLSGRTSVENLYACGECSHTGLHGANRLASNSLLEALVYSHRIFLDIKNDLPLITRPAPVNYCAVTLNAEPREKWIEEKRMLVRMAMSRHAGIVRTNEGLAKTKKLLDMLALQLEELYSVSVPSVSMCELRNILAVARLILEHSIRRKENKGTYFNSDLK